MLTEEQADRMGSFGQGYRKLRSGNPQREAQDYGVDVEPECQYRDRRKLDGYRSF